MERESSARYLIGIDLGTTNSAAAWFDARQPEAGIRIFQVPQLVAPGELGQSPVLPSFLYLPDDQERDAGLVRLPWDDRPAAVAGIFARDQGALVPARQIASVKSWLSNRAVDRTARLLPWGADGPGQALSPVEASAQYLVHLRNAWNHVFARGGDDEAARFERQTIVLTVPASFDQEARELTLQAAREAALERLTLLEEPLAAFYAWIAANRRALARHVADGDLILVCDVGGGTTDFTLVRVRIDAGELVFERIAIGEHLLLGGDNVDLALALRVERKLAGANVPEGHAPGFRLTLTQRQALRRQCSEVKERLLGDRSVPAARVAILGAGRAVVGGALGAELTQTEVEETLAEFLPLTARDDLPARDRRAGLRELGLPFESEPAITRHLAAFLTRAARVMAGNAAETPASRAPLPMVRPDAVLFNGGFFAPALARERIASAIAEWFHDAGAGGSDPAWRPQVLANRRPEAAVAIGAAYYAELRRSTEGPRLLVRAGSARAYYVGVHDDRPVAAGIRAVCVMPRGTDEGTRLELRDLDFKVMTNQPVSFTLYSSTTRTDPHGTVVRLTGDDELHRHAPLITVLRYGRKSRRVELGVRLVVHFTEVGTLELWCESETTAHRWRLQFQLRSAETGDIPIEAAAPDSVQPAPEGDQALLSDETIEAAAGLIREVFDGRADPETLVTRLEALFGYGKHAWPTGAIRPLADALLEVSGGRRAGPRVEARWLNLFGFCLRPGFGAALDGWRIGEARKIYLAGLAFPKDIQCQVEWLVLWQRVSAGFTTGQQRELFQRVAPLIGVGGRKPAGRLNPQIEREAWRLVASLERLDSATRGRIGDDLLARIRKEPRTASFLWSLGRVGARIPFYGPLNTVVPSDTAERWLQRLLELSELTPDAALAIAQIGARTDDHARDIGEALRQRAIERLTAAGAGEDLTAALRAHVPPARAAAARLFGESLPEGLRI